MSSGKAGWWVYIVQCADGTFYTGVTTAVARRVGQHNAGTASKYTRSRRPVRLVYRECASGRGPALSREAAIKKLTRRAKDMLIAGRAKKKNIDRGRMRRLTGKAS